MIVARLLLVAPLLALGIGGASAQPRGVEGLWVTPGYGSVVRVTREGDALEAVVVWLWRDAIDGRRTLDENNPAESRRERPLLGLSLFRNVDRDGDGWRGRIYNPEDGRRYRATLTQRSANLLRLRGCWGPFCRTQWWRRLGSFSLPTPAELGGR